MHQSHLGFYHDIVASTVSVGSGLPVSCDRGVDEIWIGFAKRWVIETVFRECSGEVVLDKDIGGRSEFLENFLPVRRLEGDCKRFFVPGWGFVSISGFFYEGIFPVKRYRFT